MCRRRVNVTQKDWVVITPMQEIGSSSAEIDIDKEQKLT